MKKIKISLPFVALLLTAFAGFAFNSFTPTTFQFDGSGSRVDPANYFKVTVAPDCEIVKEEVCYIVAEPQASPNQNLPNITSSLETEINTAVANHTESANVKLTELP